MRYKYKIDRETRVAVEHRLRRYETDKKELAELRTAMLPSAVARYSLTPGSHEAHRSTEETAEHIMDDPAIKHLEARVEAVERAMKRLSPIDRRIVKLAYFRSDVTPTGAGLKIGLTKSATYCHINYILGICAEELHEF